MSYFNQLSAIFTLLLAILELELKNIVDNSGTKNIHFLLSNRDYIRGADIEWGGDDESSLNLSVYIRGADIEWGGDDESSLNLSVYIRGADIE